MPARGPWALTSGAKSLDGTVTTRAAFAHFDDRLEKDIPLMHSSDSSVLVGTICHKDKTKRLNDNKNSKNNRVTL